MAVGFNPKYIEEISLQELNQREWLVLAFMSLQKMGWRVLYLSEHGFIAHSNSGAFKRNFEMRGVIQAAHVEIKCQSTGSEMVDWGKNKKNVEIFAQTFEEIKSAASPYILQTKFAEIEPHLAPAGDDILLKPAPTAKENFSDFLSMFKPAEGYYVTPVVVNLNIVLFAAMIIISGTNIMQPDTETLLKWGANFRPVTLSGEWWRLLTNCFLHIGIIHLLMNMYALVYIGVMLEPILGTARYLTAYILTGIAASTTSLWWHDFIISAGASGAIFGMYGVFLALLTTSLIEKTTRQALLASIGIFVAFNLFYGLQGGIDNAAHIGGLISGIITGYASIPSLKNNGNKNLRYVSLGVLTVLIVGFSFAAIKFLPNDSVVYDAKMKLFSENENKALEIYRLPDTTPNEKLLQAIEQDGIVRWEENIRLIEEVQKLKLPKEYRERNNTLLQYCKLRIQSYKLLSKSLTENSNDYQPEIDNVNKMIEALLDSMNGNVHEK